MGLDRTGFSPRVQRKMVHAGVHGASYQQASRDLDALCDLSVKPKPIERMVRQIGQERIDQRNAAVAAHQQLPLMAKEAVADSKRPCPAVALVSIDGGRLQVRSAPAEASSTGPERSSHWRESKVAVLETYQSETYQADPDPGVPRCFLDLKRTTKLVRGLGHPMPVGLDFDTEAPPTAKEAPPTATTTGAQPRPRRVPNRRGTVATAKRVPDVRSAWFGASWRVGRVPPTLAR